MRSQYCCEVATEKEKSIAYKADSTLSWFYLGAGQSQASYTANWKRQF